MGGLVMAGHNKWSSIKHKKAKTDAIKGKAFTKAVREIMAAVKEGGSDAEGNARLRLAIEKAKQVNMPNDNIKKAIQRADKSGDGAAMEELLYEGYAPGGVAILVSTLTDNRKRTQPEVRAVFSKNGGNIGESGSVSWMFKKKGLIVINDEKFTEDDLFDIAIEAGAEDIVTQDDGSIEITTAVESYFIVQQEIKKTEANIESMDITYIPDNTISIEDAESASKVLRMIEKFEELDDVQNVYANFDVSNEIMDQVDI